MLPRAGTDLRGMLSEGSGDAGVHSARRRRRLAGSDGRPAMLARAASARGAGGGAPETRSRVQRCPVGVGACQHARAMRRRSLRVEFTPIKTT